MNLWRCSLIPKENPGAAAGASGVDTGHVFLASMIDRNLAIRTDLL
jgi:hypothetical protein